MNPFLVSLAVVAGGVILAVFVAGAVSPAVRGRGKNRSVAARRLLMKMPPDLNARLRAIWLAHRRQDRATVNDLVAELDNTDISLITQLTGPEKRPLEFSSGKRLDNVAWTAMETSLRSRGFSASASRILTAIVIHDLDRVLGEVE